MQLNEMESISHSSDSSQFFAVIIANPTSGNGAFLLQNRHFDETLAFLRNHGWQAELWYTQSAGDGEQLARKAVKQQVNLVIAAGGDGTINEIIQGLAGSETALTVPLGRTPNAVSLPANPWIISLIVPSPPAAITRFTCCLTAFRANCSPSPADCVYQSSACHP